MHHLARNLLAAILAIASPLSAPAEESQPAAVKALVAAARETVTRVDMAAFRKAADPAGKVLVVDVREPDEFAAGHVPGAVNIPRGLIEFRIWPYIGYPEHPDMAREIYLYCSWGSRSTLAARSLQQLGFSRVIAVDMQLADWEAAGYPLTEPDF